MRVGRPWWKRKMWITGITLGVALAVLVILSAFTTLVNDTLGPPYSGWRQGIYKVGSPNPGGVRGQIQLSHPLCGLSLDFGCIEVGFSASSTVPTERDCTQYADAGGIGYYCTGFCQYRNGTTICSGAVVGADGSFDSYKDLAPGAWNVSVGVCGYDGTYDNGEFTYYRCHSVSLTPVEVSPGAYSNINITV